MLSTWSAFGSITRTVSKKRGFLKISEWISSCKCSTLFQYRHQPRKTENTVLDGYCFWYSKDEDPGKQDVLVSQKKTKQIYASPGKERLEEVHWKPEHLGDLLRSLCRHEHFDHLKILEKSYKDRNINISLNVIFSPITLTRNNKMRYHGIMSHLRFGQFYRTSVKNHARHVHTLLDDHSQKVCAVNPVTSGPNTVDRKMVIRHKSTKSFFKNLMVKLFKEQDLQAKVEVLKKREAKRIKKETETKSSLKQGEEDMTGSHDLVKPLTEKPKEMLSNLIYGCVSSKHLLDLIIPWIDNKKLSLDDTVKAFEHLQSLVYAEIMEQYPDLPYGSVSIMHWNLKVLHEEKNVFAAIHEHVTFRTLVQYLEQNSESLTKCQFTTSFSCLKHLGVSNEEPVMTKFYIRLINSDQEGYSIRDIENLYYVATGHSNRDLVLASYVSPKLSQCLKVFDSKSMDLDTFQALVFAAKKMVWTLKDSDVVLLYSHIYKVSVETNCLDDLNCACELLSHLSKKFYDPKQLAVVSSVYFQILKVHNENVVQIMSDKCLEKIEERTKELSPLKIKKLKDIFAYSLYRTKLYYAICSQVEYFLNSRLTELSLPELIWVLSFPRMYENRFEPEVATTICDKFEKLDLPNLHQIFSFVKFLNVSHPEIAEIIIRKALVYMNEITHHEEIFHKTLIFNWGLWKSTKNNTYFRRDFELALQHSFLGMYKNSCVGFKTSFASSALMTLPRVTSLMLPTLHLLDDISSKETVFKTLSPGNLFVVLNSVCPRELNSSEANENPLYTDCRSLYESVMFRIFYKSVVQFYRTLNQDVFTLHVFVRTVNLLPKKLIDALLVSVGCMKLAETPMLRVYDFKEVCRNKKVPKMLKKYKTQRETFLHNFVTFALENAEVFTFKEWRRTVRFLLECNYRVGDNKEIQNLLQKIVFEEFSVEANFCIFVSHCCRLGMDMSKALKIIFSIEYLKSTDHLISENSLDENSMTTALFKLNQIACISYPELKVPWLQETEDVVRICTRTTEEWRFIPKDVGDVISRIAGGDRFVGKEVLLDYGIPAWRVLLIDQDNRPVEFTTRNLKLASEMNCKRLIIWYLLGSYDVHHDLLKQAGYSAVVVYRSEWNSLGLGLLEDRLQFMREKLFEHTGEVKPHDPMTVNCDKVSSQWKQFLAA